jgi:hypothetical protein
VIPLAVVAGYAAGFLIAVATVAAETSRIAFGNYALYGNGAIIVPAILAPFALYPGWIGVMMRGGDHRLEAAMYTLGLHLGVGMVSVIEVLVNPQPNSTLLGALPGLLLAGTLFVIPAALFAGATLWLIRSGRLTVTPLTAAFGIVIATLLSLLFGAGLGILSGAAIALALERPERRTTIGLALFALLLIVGNAPFITTAFAGASL